MNHCSISKWRIGGLFLPCLLLLGTTGRAQTDDSGFNLFEDVEQNTPQPNIRERAEERRARGETKPEFVLVGTSRIGNKQRAMLTHRDGQVVSLTIPPNSSTEIPGYTQFQVVDIGAGQVSINYPESIPCMEFKEAGVSCNTNLNIAVLTLTNGAPLAPRVKPVTQELQADPENPDAVAEAEDIPTNPFAALRALTQAQQANGGNAPADGEPAGVTRTFTPRRIDPADVPPGMRIVSTPFGDRLVEQ